MSFFARYCRSRRRRPTRSSSPRRLWWSCLWVLRCSVRSRMRWLRSATWASGEPVSPGVREYSSKIFFLVAASSGTQAPSGGSLRGAPGWSLEALWIRGRSDGNPKVTSRSRRPRPRDLLRQQGAYLLDVPAHLLDERVDARELLGVADPGDDVERDVLVVEAEVRAIEDVGLDPALLPAEGGVRPDRDGSGKPRLVVGPAPDEPPRINAVGRHGGS